MAAYPAAYPAGYPAVAAPAYPSAYGYGAHNISAARYPAALPTAFAGHQFAGAFPGAYAHPTVAHPASSALALDAADGVIDGKFHGAPIVNAGAPAFTGSYAGAYGGGFPYGARSTYGATPFAGAYGAAPYAAHTYGATPFAGHQFAGAFPGAYAHPTVAHSASSALALDAADGVIDGKFHGAPIAAAAPAFPYGRSATYGATPFAGAYGAAPFAAPFAGHAYGAPFAAQTYGATPFAGHYGAGYGAPLATNYGAPLATSITRLGAGVLPTNFAGHYGAGYGAPLATNYGAPLATSVTRLSAPVSYGAPMTSYPGAYGAPHAYGAPFAGGFAAHSACPAAVVAPNATSAAALDAADGVIDGRLNGVPIARQS